MNSMKKRHLSPHPSSIMVALKSAYWHSFITQQRVSEQNDKGAETYDDGERNQDL